MEAGSHRFEEHTGEVQVHLHAPDRAGLYRQAALALAELMAPGAGPCEGEALRLEVQGRDAAALLVAFVDELIYRVETTGSVFPEVEIERVEAGRLVALVRGCRPASFKTAVKAATFHGLAVEEDERGFVARLVLDV